MTARVQSIRAITLILGLSLLGVAPICGANANPFCENVTVRSPGTDIEVHGSPNPDVPIITSPGTELTFSVTAGDVDWYGDPEECSERRLKCTWTDSDNDSGHPVLGDPTTYKFTPPAEGTYTVSCEVDEEEAAGTIGDDEPETVSWTVKAVKVHVWLNGVDVTDTETDTIVGLHDQFTVSVVPADLSFSGPLWDIPGHRIKDWSHGYLAAHVDESNVMDLAQSEVGVYWVDGGDGRTVTCQITVNGVLMSGSAAINVKRPTASVSTTTQSVIVGLYANGNRAMGLFRGLPNWAPGIVFTRSLTEPQGFQPGATSWYQVVETYTMEFTDSFGVVWRKSGANHLDTSDPYDIDAQVDDAPANEDIDSDTHEFANVSFSMYLMYTPAGNDVIPVPLSKVSWYYTGEATRVGQTWSLGNHGNSVNPSGVDCTAHPAWVNNTSEVPAVAQLHIATASQLPGATKDSTYSQQLNCVGGKAPILWSLSSGSLPPGFTLSSGGSVAGTPSQAGDCTFGAGAADSSIPSFHDSRTFSLHVEDPS